MHFCRSVAIPIDFDCLHSSTEISLCSLAKPDNEIFCTFMIYVVITLHWYRAARVTLRSPACVANDNVFTPACTDTIDTLLCCAILHTDILSPCVLCNATALYSALMAHEFCTHHWVLGQYISIIAAWRNVVYCNNSRLQGGRYVCSILPK